MASGVSLCGKEGERVPPCHSGNIEGWKATRNTGTALVVMLGGNLPCGSDSPRGQRVPALPHSGCWCRVAAHQRPFLLWGCSLSTAWFLQDDSKQRALTAPSENGGSLCRSPGEFWKKRQDGSSFLLNQHICRTEDGGAAAALCPEEVGAHQERQKSLGPFKNDEHSRCCLPQLCPQNRAHGSPLPR